jgi:hypothetical protein
MQRASQFFSRPSPISQPHSSDIDIHSLVASYENEARKEVLSAFYVAHAVLVEYDIEGSLPLPSDELQTLFDIYIVDLLSLSSLLSSTRSFSRLLPPPTAPLSMSMA